MKRVSKYLSGMLAAAAILIPVALWAHAELTRSAPSAKEILARSPAEIRLWFSEAPELRLTKVSVSDSAGHSMRVGSVWPITAVHWSSHRLRP
jgi:methionine-rich copper-binding protein CopC